MNLGIYRSWFALVAIATVALFAAWHAFDGSPFGSRDTQNVVYLLATGWIAVILYLALALYAVRRAAHRLRLSPEFGWQAKLPQLERTQSALLELQNKALRGEVSGIGVVRREAKAIVRRSGLQRVLKVDVRRDPKALTALRVHVDWRQPLAPLAAWLHAHLWLGFAAAAIVWFHGGGRTASTMGMLLNVLSYAVIGSGIVGAILWTFGPTWLTRAERDASVEKAFALSEHYDRKVAEAVAAMQGAPEEEQEKLRRDLSTLTGQQEAIRRELRRLGFFRELLRGWRLLHVPCSIALLALVAVHVIAVCYY
jgi:hypothetical protein